MKSRYLWHPPKELVENSNVKRFMEKHGFRSYDELVKKSTEDIVWWWGTAEKELDVRWFEGYEKVLDVSRGVEWAQWFIGGKLNAAYNSLDRHAKSKNRDKVAFIWSGENGETKKYTYWELYVESNRFANYLNILGVGKGDVVALYSTMVPETVVALFATLKIGAIFMPIFSGFGAQAVATRLQDSGAKVVVTIDGYYRKGRKVYAKPVLDKAVELAGSKVDRVVVVERLGDGVEMVEDRDVSYSEVLRDMSGEFDTTPMGADEPALLLYSSGTTGKPKGCVISHAGALLQPAKEHYFNMDIKPDDTLFWITDIGWMMGPWQIIGAQHLGATHLIMEGAIDYPEPDRIWSIVERYGVTHLGFSATVVRMLKRYGNSYVEKHDLSTLKAFGNTGEPIDPDSWIWLMEVVGEKRCPIINLSGGTEIFGCFLLPSPVVPLKPSTLWGPGLGMDIDVFNDEGKPVRGEVGYLVCKKPAPSMTRGFWRNPKRYIETYWSRFPGVWYHGDWAYIDEDGFWFLLGRADDVIKVAGKRIGPAEIEGIINSHKAVAESACIGYPHSVKGEVIVCLAMLKPGFKGSTNLEKELKNLVAESLGKPFKPHRILFVRDLPRTRSGKIMRRVIRAVARGGWAGDKSVMENPDSIEYIKEALENLEHV